MRSVEEKEAISKGFAGKKKRNPASSHIDSFYRGLPLEEKSRGKG